MARHVPCVGCRSTPATVTCAAPAHVIWGSDWPHTGYFDAARMPDPGKLLRALADFIPDRTLRDQVLTTNPLKLLRVAL